MKRLGFYLLAFFTTAAAYAQSSSNINKVQLKSNNGPVSPPKANTKKAPPQQKKMNVVFFLVDDMGWSDVGFNNANTFYETPNIDAFAKQGVKFTQAYAACHVCSPSRGSILS